MTGQKKKYVDLIEESLGNILEVHESAAPNEVSLGLRPDALRSLPDLCSLLTKSLKAQLTTVAANDERAQSGVFALYYVFALSTDDIFLLVRVPVDPRHMEVPSVSHIIEGADWFERENKDWFGIFAFPNIRSLAAHPDWPVDVHPMGKDFSPATDVPRIDGTFDFRRVEGEGVFEIPVGPVHAGIIEPGHFRFSVAGEPIVNLEVQLFYTHKATEKIAEGRSAQKTVHLAERISGDSSFAHATAFCHSVERLSGCEVSRRATVVRTMLLELERLSNHLGDVGSILLDVGFSAGAAAAFELKEHILHLNEILTGSRLLRGVAAIGGVRRDPEDTPAKREALRETMASCRTSFEELVNLVFSSSSVLDRLETTGRLGRSDAYRLGITGIAGRASGIDRDYRRDHPHCAYSVLRFRVSTHHQGDVLARMNVRIDEIRETFLLLEQLRGQHLHEPTLARDVVIPAHRSALGYVEGWRGEIVHWTMTDAQGNVERWKVTDPSFRNWRALPLAVRNNIVPDFPVINKSFNLSYSGNDR